MAEKDMVMGSSNVLRESQSTPQLMPTLPMEPITEFKSYPPKGPILVSSGRKAREMGNLKNPMALPSTLVRVTSLWSTKKMTGLRYLRQLEHFSGSLVP